MNQAQVWSMKITILQESSTKEKCSQPKKSLRRTEEKMKRRDRTESISLMMRSLDLTLLFIVKRLDLRMIT